MVSLASSRLHEPHSHGHTQMHRSRKKFYFVFLWVHCISLDKDSWKDEGVNTLCITSFIHQMATKECVVGISYAGTCKWKKNIKAEFKIVFMSACSIIYHKHQPPASKAGVGGGGCVFQLPSILGIFLHPTTSLSVHITSVLLRWLSRSSSLNVLWFVSWSSLKYMSRTPFRWN